jgi:hypothetical protein
MDRRTPSLGALTSGADAVALGGKTPTGLSSGQLRSWLGPTLYSRRRVVAQQRGAELGAGRDDHFGHKTLRVVGVRDDDADHPPVLVVEDLAE